MTTPLAGIFARAIVTVLIIGTVTACGTAPALPGTPTRVLPTGSTGQQRGVLEMTVRNDGQAVTLPAPAADVYAALEGAYADLQIPLTRKDAAARVLGNDGLKMRRQLGKIELRKAFDCGGTAGMPNSETYQIFATIVSSVEGDGGNTVLTTVIDASGENPSYPGSGVRCSSSGSIEAAIIKEVRARLNSR
jgi:hypothetical protein